LTFHEGKLRITQGVIETFHAVFVDAHIPHVDKVITAKDLPWFNSAVKNSITGNLRSKLYRKIVKSMTPNNVNRFNDSVRHVRELVS
jgi:hypothetical protein